MKNTMDRPAWRATILPAVALWAATALAPACGQESDRTSFASENEVAMAAMMRGMSVAPGGSIDRDFATMMIAHHQGAVDMAQAELRHGSNERLRRLAQGIVIEQRQEIAAMQRVLDQELTPHGVSPRPMPPARSPASSPAHVTHAVNP